MTSRAAPSALALASDAALVPPAAKAQAVDLAALTAQLDTINMTTAWLEQTFSVSLADGLTTHDKQSIWRLIKAARSDQAMVRGWFSAAAITKITRL